ncbi:MAG: hypothetical protein JWO92_2528 [Chitinophagaceae bacterium]|nr:hypothetical protein [Chitinophagaceae bacterium]
MDKVQKYHQLRELLTDFVENDCYSIGYEQKYLATPLLKAINSFLNGANYESWKEDNQQKVDKLNPENIDVKEAIENAITAVGVLKTILTKLNLGGVESANNLIKRLEDIILPFDPSNKYIGKIGGKVDTPLKEDEQDELWRQVKVIISNCTNTAHIDFLMEKLKKQFKISKL